MPLFRMAVTYREIREYTFDAVVEAEHEGAAWCRIRGMDTEELDRVSVTHWALEDDIIEIDARVRETI